MKRILLGLLTFWVLLAGALVLVVVLTEEQAPLTPPPPGPMTCDSLQRRAQECADDLSDLAGDFLASDAKRRGLPALAIEARRTAAITVVHAAIGDRQVASYCQRYHRSRHPQVRRIFAGLRDCFRRPGCPAFTACLRDFVHRLDLGALLPD